MYLENLSAEVMGKFDSGQKLFIRKDVEILLARIQQLEIAAQLRVQLTEGGLAENEGESKSPAFGN